MVYIFPEASYFTTILREHWKDFSRRSRIAKNRIYFLWRSIF